MSIPSKPYTIRLPKDLTDRFDEVQREFPALKIGVVLRLMLASVLERPLDERIAIVASQIRKPRKR